VLDNNAKATSKSNQLETEESKHVSERETDTMKAVEEGKEQDGAATYISKQKPQIRQLTFFS
jgi:hypothetical protein